MERSEILDMMTALQLAGMRAVYDEIVTTGVKRQQGGSAPRIDPYRHPSATRCSSPPLLRYAPQLRP